MPRTEAGKIFTYRKVLGLVRKVKHRQGEILEIVRATRPSGGLAGGLDRRQQQRHQYADDRDHYQQFDKRETM
jgi:hypothetical protein